MRYFHNSFLCIYFGRFRLTVKTRSICPIASLPKIEVHRILSQKLLPLSFLLWQRKQAKHKQNWRTYYSQNTEHPRECKRSLLTIDFGSFSDHSVFDIIQSGLSVSVQSWWQISTWNKCPGKSRNADFYSSLWSSFKSFPCVWHQIKTCHNPCPL